MILCYVVSGEFGKSHDAFEFIHMSSNELNMQRDFEKVGVNT